MCFVFRERHKLLSFDCSFVYILLARPVKNTFCVSTCITSDQSLLSKIWPNPNFQTARCEIARLKIYYYSKTSFIFQAVKKSSIYSVKKHTFLFFVSQTYCSTLQDDTIERLKLFQLKETNPKCCCTWFVFLSLMYLQINAIYLNFPTWTRSAISEQWWPRQWMGIDPCQQDGNQLCEPVHYHCIYNQNVISFLLFNSFTSLKQIQLKRFSGPEERWMETQMPPEEILHQWCNCYKWGKIWLMRHTIRYKQLLHVDSTLTSLMSVGSEPEISASNDWSWPDEARQRTEIK